MSPAACMALGAILYAAIRYFAPMDAPLLQLGFFCAGLLASDIYSALKR